MIKIKLSLDELRVESFTTSAVGRDRGTVVGHEKTDTTCGGVTGCGTECETYYGNGACSADDGCASAPHAYTPCAGCQETEICVIGGW
ncbi:MAG TPA: pinensin family lanthipeptide [Longimicrobium sp.]|jgi:hypothetical protein